MAVMTAVPNPAAPEFSKMFNWGVKLTEFNELFVLAGRGAIDQDGKLQHPGDAIGQTRYILEALNTYLELAGYSKHDIFRIELTLTKDVSSERYPDIYSVFAAFFDDVVVKPSGGTLRVVDGLADPGMLVEYEFWAAK